MIYKIETWHKVDAAGNVVQELFCLSDMHSVEAVRPHDAVMMNNVDQEQRKVLTDYAEQLKKDNTLFIVEDVFYNDAHTHKKIAAFIPLQKAYGFAQPEGQRPVLLQFLADILSAHGCDVVSVECRQQRLISYMFFATLVQFRATNSPLLSAYYTNINTLYGPTLQEVAQEFKDALAQVHHYRLSDGDALADYYTGIIAELEKTVPYADLLSSTNYFYWDCATALNDAVKQTAINAFLLWGSELLDAYALHTLYNASDRKKVCILLGGVHITNISQQLPRLGYQKVHTVGADSLTEQEYAQRAPIMEALFNVNQLVPIRSESWFGRAIDTIKRRFSKNIMVNSLVIDTEKTIACNKLLAKFAQVKPVSNADFAVLVGTGKSMQCGVSTQHESSCTPF